MKKYLSLLFFIVMYCCCIYGQHTYIIEGNTKTYDALLQKEKTFLPYQRLIELKKDTFIIHSPYDIEGYKQKYGRPFVSRANNEGEQVFMEVLVEGRLNLMKYIDTSFVTQYYLEVPGSEEAIALSNRGTRFRRTIKTYWEDCKDLKKAIDKTSYKELELIRLIKAYDKCDYIRIPETELNVNIGVGLTTLKVSSTFDNPSVVPSGSLISTIDNEARLSYIFSSDLTIPIFGSHGYILTGAHMMYNNARHERYDFLGSITTIEATTLDLAIPVGFKYVFEGRKYMPFLGLSFGPSFAIIKDVNMIRDVLNQDGTYTRTTSEGGVNTFGLAPDLFIGTHMYLNESTKLNVKLGYRTRFNTGDFRLYNYNTFYLTFGMRIL